MPVPPSSQSPSKNGTAGLWQELKTNIEIPLLISILLLGVGLWLFVELADEVLEGDTLTIDETILLAMRNPNDRSDPLGPPWLEEMGRDFTALGGSGVVWLVTAVVCLYLAVARRWSLVWLILIVVVGSLLLNQLLKAGFNRPRPDLVPHGMVVYQASFPSGHAMLSASVYLTLGVLLARLQQTRTQAIMIMGTAILVTVLVGISRVYLAVHWPSDVLAGWVAGSIWALACWLAARQIRRYRQQKESESMAASIQTGEGK